MSFVKNFLNPIGKTTLAISLIVMAANVTNQVNDKIKDSFNNENALNKIVLNDNKSELSELTKSLKDFHIEIEDLNKPFEFNLDNLMGNMDDIKYPSFDNFQILSDEDVKEIEAEIQLNTFNNVSSIVENSNQFTIKLDNTNINYFDKFAELSNKIDSMENTPKQELKSL